jgi:hypothetical protein
MIEWRPTEDSITDVEKEKGIDSALEGQIQVEDRPHEVA